MSLTFSPAFSTFFTAPFTAALAFLAGAGFLVTFPVVVFLVSGLLVLALAAGFLATGFLVVAFLVAGAGAAMGSMIRGLALPVLERVCCDGC